MEKEVGGKKFDIRPLKRGEVKTLRKKGFNLANLSLENADDAIDEVIEMICKDRLPDIDGLANTDALELFKSIIDLTYGRGEAEKNLQTSGDGVKAAGRTDATDA